MLPGGVGANGSPTSSGRRSDKRSNREKRPRRGASWKTGCENLRHSPADVETGYSPSLGMSLGASIRPGIGRNSLNFEVIPA
jgi:hypothetical protein